MVKRNDHNNKSIQLTDDLSKIMLVGKSDNFLTIFTADAIRVEEKPDGAVVIEAAERPADKSGLSTGNCSCGYSGGYIFCYSNPYNSCSGSCSGPYSQSYPDGSTIYYCNCV
jgi:hypothetical protein